MNQQLTQKLVKRFPVLYQDFYSPMSQTCMCWGFDHGDGWFDIIWQLSLAIEEELGYTWYQKKIFLFKKEFVRRWNKLIYTLSPVRLNKYKMEQGDDKVRRQVLVEKAKLTWDAKIAQFLFGKTEKIGKWETDRILLKKLVITNCYTGLAVQQVKEKFGTLRYYCNGSDNMDRLINLAKILSAVTCENCGKYGKIRQGGWIRTLCDDCDRKRTEKAVLS